MRDDLETDICRHQRPGHPVLRRARARKRFRPEHQQLDDWIEGQWSKVSRSLDLLEAKWLDRLNLPLDVGQIGVACALGYLDFRHEDRYWRGGRPGLTAWFDEIAKQKALKSTTPIG